MAAWAPWVGVYGMGLIAALLAYALALLVTALWHRRLDAQPVSAGARQGRRVATKTGLQAARCPLLGSRVQVAGPPVVACWVAPGAGER
jgi:apolipoprotein N-acyltransferase